MSKVHFILDEFALIGGHLDSIESALGIGRGYAVKLQIYLQSVGQLKMCFPDGRESNVIANCSQVYFSVNDFALAEIISSRLGEHTIVLESGGSGDGSSHQWSNGQHASTSGGNSYNNSRNWSQQARKLLKPEEIIALPPRTAITFTPGVPPICTTLTRYYEKEGLLGKSGRYRDRYGAFSRFMRLTGLCAALIAFAVRMTPALIRVLKH